MAWQAPAPHQESCHQLRLPSLVQLKDALNAMVDGSLHILAQETADVSSLEVGPFACAQIQLRLRPTIRLSRVTSTSFGSKGTTLGPQLATAIKSPQNRQASLDKGRLPPGCAAPAEASGSLGFAAVGLSLHNVRGTESTTPGWTSAQADPSGELRFWCRYGGTKLKGQRLL